MKDSIITSINNPIDEARRYVANARDVLRANGKLNPETWLYENPKYVNAAGHYLWSGALISLESVFHVKHNKKKRKGDNARVDIDDYIAAISKRDQKLLNMVVNAYHIAHLYMGYDGIQSKATCDEGFRIVNEIINRCEKMTPSIAA